MPRFIVLDSFLLSSVAKRDASPGSPAGALDRCRFWVQECLRADNVVVAPAICYYEVLRELQRLGATSQVDRLRAFCHAEPDRYLPLSDAHLEHAARLWADARNAGMPTAGLESPDCDVLLAAQALSVQHPGHEAIVATTNPGHLARFVGTEHWERITP